MINLRKFSYSSRASSLSLALAKFYKVFCLKVRIWTRSVVSFVRLRSTGPLVRVTCQWLCSLFNTEPILTSLMEKVNPGLRFAKPYYQQQFLVVRLPVKDCKVSDMYTLVDS